VSDLENRMKKLEQKQSEGDKPRTTIVYVYDGKSETETEAARQKAVAEYKEKHPDWQPSLNDIYIHVLSENAKKLTEEILAGEGT